MLTSWQNQKPIRFRAAMTYLADDLLEDIRIDQLLHPKGEMVRIVIEPFSDAHTGDVPRVSRDIEAMLIALGKKAFIITRMTSENLERADYMIRGRIGLEPYKGGKTAAPEKYYHVTASVVKTKTGKSVGHSSAWIADKKPDMTPISFYKDSPVYLKDSQDQDRTAISAETAALLTEAETAYGKREYKKAIALLNRALKRKDGPLIRIYGGLYSANRKLGRQDRAIAAFDKLLAVSVEKYNILTVKFLFNVNSVEFWNDPALREQYKIWLERIGVYFKTHRGCLQILGHCSRSGTETYNKELSHERAVGIQARLRPYFPDVLRRSETVGRGFRETIVGTGTDDWRDAIDRRVEFHIIDCKALSR
ncbi:OmpA family protein [Desulfonema ishimotonii]|nr:hypothetical protein [Desulfonema ishimotonii]